MVVSFVDSGVRIAARVQFDTVERAFAILGNLSLEASP
jgi:hypothetical protein